MCFHMTFTINTETWKAWEGRVVDGKFTLGQWVGGSDHSAVFAIETKEQAPSKLAIKLIAAEPGKSDVQLSRWRAAAQLSHPNLIRIFGVGQCKLDQTSLLYVVMEAAEEDLSQILPQRALEAAETADLLPQILDGLVYLHGKGFVHGHLQPTNVHAVGVKVKLSADQVTSLADTNSTRRRRDVYDAPETAAGIISPASDIWSLGVTLMAALTQDIPRETDGSKGDPGLPASIPEPFRGIVRECLHLDPRQRSSLADIRAKLIPSAPVAAVEPEIPTPPRPNSKRNWVFIATSVLIVVGVLFAYWKFSRPPVAQQPAPQAASTVDAPPPSAPTTSPAASESKPVAKTTSPSPGQVLHQALPDISASARRTIRGTVKIKVRVEVNSSGKVTAAKLAAPASSRYFADHTLQAAKAWDFSPPQVDGQPGESRWLLEFRLQRSGTRASAQRITR